MHVSKAGHGNDRVWKTWKGRKPASHIPTASTAGMYLKATAKNRSGLKSRPIRRKELVTDVPGPKCNECSGTLSPQPRPGFRIHTAKACQSMGRRCGQEHESLVREAGCTDKWITSGLPVTLHQRTQPAREHQRANEDENEFDPTFYEWAPSDHVQPHHCYFGILALESLITGDPLVSPAR
jgi:hypothetical protein